MESNQIAVSMTDAAKLLGVSRPTVYQYAHMADFPAFRVGGRVLIGHCFNESAALKLKDLLLKEFPEAQIDLHPTRGLCSFYAEKGGLMVGFEKQGAV